MDELGERPERSQGRCLHARARELTPQAPSRSLPAHQAREPARERKIALPKREAKEHHWVP